jgi:putative ABC transport system permease protein
MRRGHWLEDTLRDVKYAGRGLSRSRGLTAAVTLTLGLGIGSNTAIFSVVDQLLLRPLPYPAGDQLVTVYEAGLGDAGHMDVSPANWLDWQRDSRTIQTFAAWRTASQTLTGIGEPTRVRAQLVSAEFFPLLGVRPWLGRVVTPDDDRPHMPPVAVVSYEFWQQRLSGNRGAIGRTIQLDDRPVQVIGVMPPRFRFIFQDTDLWTAWQLDRQQQWRETAGRFMNVVGRLRPGTTLMGARAEMAALAGQMAGRYAFNKNTTVALVPLREELTGEVHGSLIALSVAVAVLLSIACLNVANLLLARAAARSREMAIRTSLGAGRGTIVRQWLVESLLLAAAGGGLGMLVARWILSALVAAAPPDLLHVATLSIDRRVLLYAMVVSMATGVLVGLAPALVLSRQSLTAALRGSGRTLTHAPRIRETLLVGQVALTVVLLCGAGLLVRTVLTLNAATHGFDKGGLLTAELDVPDTRYSADATVALYREVLARLRALPGVESAAAASSLPVIGSPRGGTAFHRLGTPQLPINDSPSTVVRVVTPSYFHTLRIPVLRGREFTDADGPSAGFIVNQAFVHAHLRDIDPLKVALSVWMEDQNPHLPIVGVVGDVSEGSVREHARPTVFYNHRRMTEGGMTLFIRGSHPTLLANATRGVVHAIDPNLAVTNIRTFDRALGESVARERLSALISVAFAVSGLVLAALGLYGVLAFLVTERTREIGIRMALGAGRSRLTAGVVGDGMRLVGIGATTGVLSAFGLLRWTQALLFGISSYDPWTYAGALMLLAAIAALASYLPARRAAHVDPSIALRAE